MNEKTFKGGLLASAAMTILLLPTEAAFAQDAVLDEPSTEGADNFLDPDAVIVVTAQRRSEAISRSPVAVSVVTSQTLQDQAIVTETDLQTRCTWTDHKNRAKRESAQLLTTRPNRRSVL